MSMSQTGLELSDDRKSVISYSEGASTVSVPDSVTALPEGLFAHCTSLVSVKLPSGLKALPRRLFEGCSALSRVRLPQEVSSAGEACFAGCTSLESAPTCPGMTEIAPDMFKGCTGLTAFAVPEGVKAIRQGAFAGCTGLESLVLSASVAQIEEGAFDGCSALRRIRVADENHAYYMEENDGMLRSKADGEIVLCPGAGGAAEGKAGLLKAEEEIDLSPNGTEEDDWGLGGKESMEAMNNNFIGEEDEDAESEEAKAAVDTVDTEVVQTAEDEKPDAAEGSEAECAAEGGNDEAVPPLEAEESESAESAAEEVAESAAAPCPPSEEEAAEPSIEEKLADIMGRNRVQETVPIAAEESELKRIALESDILSQNIFKKDEEEGGSLAADNKELERIALESDILKQNVGAGEEESSAPVSAETDELERIVLESDILSQNTRGGSEAGAGLDELVLLSKESEILRDNTKVANNITLTPTEVAAQVEGEEVEKEEVPPSPDAEETAEPALPSTPAEGETRDTVLERIKGIAEKYECIETGSGEEALYVFAEKLAGGAFSDALVRCGKRLASIHSLGRVHLFYGLPFDHAEFMLMFHGYILGKNAVFASEAGNTNVLSSMAKEFAKGANITLSKETMDEQLERAQSHGGRSFRVILQDDYSEGEQQG